MILPPKPLERYEATQSFYSCTVSSFEQHTLAQFIAQGYFERHLNKMKNYYQKQRTLLLKALHNSPLSKISTITERNAGTHFLLHVRTKLTEEEIQCQSTGVPILAYLFILITVTEKTTTNKVHSLSTMPPLPKKILSPLSTN